MRPALARIGLWDVEDVPTDRTYCDAWRRSANGGPILLDERKVRLIQEARTWAAYQAERLMVRRA